jgi:hypothetical protein
LEEVLELGVLDESDFLVSDFFESDVLDPVSDFFESELLELESLELELESLELEDESLSRLSSRLSGREPPPRLPLEERLSFL